MDQEVELRYRAEKDEPFLPETLAQWKTLWTMNPRGVSAVYLVWQHLSGVFLNRGYELYVPRKNHATEKFFPQVYPSGYVDSTFVESAAIMGNGYCTFESRRYVEAFNPRSVFWAATNKSGHEFIIKAVYDGRDAAGLRHLRILAYLARDDVQLDPRNRTVPVVELVEHEQYTFAVFPRWTKYVESDIKTPSTAIECCVQLTEGLAFLHENRIAHLNISPDNVMFNFFGYAIPGYRPIAEHLPVKYGFVDFGESEFLDGSRDAFAPPRPTSIRRTRAPEVNSGQPFDPFVADVWQMGMFMLVQFYDLTGFTREFLPILQAMLCLPEDRISMADAHQRLKSLRDAWRNDRDPYVLDRHSRQINKYTGTYLNVYRDCSGTVTLPANDEEACMLRDDMRRCCWIDSAYHAGAFRYGHMLQVDADREPSIGWVHGTNA
ncbi:kinase-like domain-containing protein [Schizophyllum amplum]|uniref:Kinase-like domain-containing protein n=1 Tax=Schizophyllum amplum TaxID=97359 RepID=A0A550C1Z1_9AGAR|nr:kinase-like domain-containing protein [Auriculariopsis ampla]